MIKEVNSNNIPTMHRINSFLSSKLNRRQSFEIMNYDVEKELSEYLLLHFGKMYTKETIMRYWRRFKDNCSPYKEYFKWEIREIKSDKYKKYLIRKMEF